MSIVVNIYYTGTDSNARKFAEEMEQSGIAVQIRKEAGNLRYEYFFPMADPETVLLIDSWEDQHSIDVHHASPMMAKIIGFREKYGLHMRVERYAKWTFSDLPIIPEEWKLTVEKDKKAQLAVLKKLLRRKDLEYVVNACDVG
mgnify:CR=1 FL=1